jgi:omega-6 fatty acid desaturase (delta-12 desaturase)
VNSNGDFDQAVAILKSFTTKDIIRGNKLFFSTIFILWTSLVLSHYFFVHFRWGLFVSIPINTLFMCRSYVIEHDCGHGSFYRTETSNFIAGTLMGFGILIPYSLWKFIHHSHHMHVGNLDQRGLNPEIWTMTVQEYQSSPLLKRLAYRFMRSKFTRFTIVPSINLA